MNRVVRNWAATANCDLRTAEAMYKAGRYLYVVIHVRMIKWLKQHLKSGE